MGVIIGISLFVGGIVVSALSQQLTDELKDWTPWVTEQLVRLAVSRLPKDRQERFGEEWRGHIIEVPGEIGRIIVSVGFIIAALRMSTILDGAGKRISVKNNLKRGLNAVATGVFFAYFAPLIGLMTLTARLCSCRLDLVRERRVGLHGRKFEALRFRVLARYSCLPLRRPQILFGSFFKWSSLGILPMLLNVIRGEMSLVGPPPRREGEA